DDRQRYLNRHELWAFDVEGQPWKASPNDNAAHTRAEKYLAYIMDRAIENLLVSHEDIVSALGVVKLAGWLPSELLGQIIEASLKKSDKFTEEDLLHAAPPSSLVTHVPLDYLWDKVIVPLIAEQHDYAAKQGGPPPSVEGGWSMRPADDASAREEIKLEAPGAMIVGSEDNDMVGEDEIIETDDEVRASESGGLGVRKAPGAPPNRKAHQG
ncbi:MAG TPA: hypothetical protein VNG33_09585, partial [Polyangiaceae bacterium]|nr:hypothetical protein [Polyangiaceae bacterium]